MSSNDGEVVLNRALDGHGILIVENAVVAADKPPPAMNPELTRQVVRCPCRDPRHPRDPWLRTEVLGFMRSEWNAARYLRSGRLEAVLEEFELPQAEIYAVYPHKHDLAAKVRAFVDYLIRHFKGPGRDTKASAGKW